MIMSMSVGAMDKQTASILKKWERRRPSLILSQAEIKKNSVVWKTIMFPAFLTTFVDMTVFAWIILTVFTVPKAINSISRVISIIGNDEA